jgi:hypothetical protein
VFQYFLSQQDDHLFMKAMVRLGALVRSDEAEREQVLVVWLLDTGAQISITHDRALSACVSWRFTDLA